MRLRLFLGALTMFVLAQVAQPAMIVVGTGGFEQPDFVLGALEGQSAAPVPPIGTWVTTGGASTATVQNTVFAPGGGTQAVEVNRAANSDERWADPITALAPSLLLIDWDMQVLETSSNAFGPFFGVEAYDDFGPLGLLARFGVDASTAELLYSATTSGVLVAPGPTVTFGQWNHFQIQLDYGLHQFSLYLNGGFIVTSGFVDQANIVGGLDHFTDADIAAIAAGGDAESLGLTGTAYFDNFEVAAVPEPASYLLSGLGLVLLAGFARRRRRV